MLYNLRSRSASEPGGEYSQGAACDGRKSRMRCDIGSPDTPSPTALVKYRCVGEGARRIAS